MTIKPNILPFTKAVLMVRPSQFEFNQQASLTNSFQSHSTLSKKETLRKVIEEFETMVLKLEEQDVEVLVFDNKSSSKILPDAVFPNNWISTHPEELLFTYPMFVPNRREERNPFIIDSLIKKYKYKWMDYSSFEKKDVYLEGTGSIVFDHYNRIAYASISPRTDKDLFFIVAEKLGYEPVFFRAFGKKGELIYHTNVMLTIGKDFAVLGIDTIDVKDKNKVLDYLTNSGKEIIQLSKHQVYNCFAGNMLQIYNRKLEQVLVLSSTAYNSLTTKQKEVLNRHNDHLCIVNIPTIEQVGGGSARCMLAEIF